ncbi:polyprotein [Shayang fly virus 4]|uniref:polyprotein n=1 Tax=Shayang fly virus 4 TaxID=1746061 RepID=UPI0007056C7D|nr:polyprotein [Shayang fly virus 4]ALL52888.1 polyprotein [Shayang fly virus 4]
MSITPNASGVARNANKLAEARILTAAVSGQTKRLTDEAKALADLANQANNAMMAVVTNMGPTVNSGIRKKRKTKNGKGANASNGGIISGVSKTIKDATNNIFIITSLTLILIIAYSTASPLNQNTDSTSSNRLGLQFFGKDFQEIEGKIAKTGLKCKSARDCTNVVVDLMNADQKDKPDCNILVNHATNLASIAPGKSVLRAKLVDYYMEPLLKCKTDIKNIFLRYDAIEYKEDPVKFMCYLLDCDQKSRADLQVEFETLKTQDTNTLREIEKLLNTYNDMVLDKMVNLQISSEITDKFQKTCKDNMNALNNRYGGRYGKISNLLEKIEKSTKNLITEIESNNKKLDNLAEQIEDMPRRIKRETSQDKWANFKSDSQTIMTCLSKLNIVCSSQATCRTSINEVVDGLKDKSVEDNQFELNFGTIKDLRECIVTGSAVHEAIEPKINEYIARHGRYVSCKAQVDVVQANLKYMTGVIVDDVEVMSEKRCPLFLDVLNEKYIQIKRFGHETGTKIDEKAVLIKPCEENKNWQHDGWLGGNSGSCATGIDKTSWDVRECIKQPYGTCMHKKSDTCVLGYGNVVVKKPNTLYTNSYKNASNPICCTMSCFELSDLYLTFTNQPLCAPCIKAFSTVFWGDVCLKHVSGEISGINIYSSQTVFDLPDHSKVTCPNAYRFNQCCAGKGPAPVGSQSVFKDKYCVCSLKHPSWYDMILAKINTLKKNVFKVDHLIAFAILFLIFCWHHGLGTVLVVAYLSWIVISVEGACHVENMVPRSAIVGLSNGLPIEHMRVRPGQCFVAGDATVEIVAIRVFHIYNFLRAIPYKIKPVCQVFDWGCKGGMSDAVYNIKSDCYNNCVPGLRKQIKGAEAEWSGDACFFMGRVATRLDVCFSYGATSTFVDLYSRISGDPHIELTVKFHGIGFEGVGHISTSSLDGPEKIKIYNIRAAAQLWPEMISYRLSKYLCAYHYVESANTCNSGDVFKPNDIDADCLNLQQRWNIEHGGYQVTYDTKDFEQQLHSSFVDCSLNSFINNTATTLKYYEDQVWAEFDISSTKFTFASSVPLCLDLNSWNISAEAGITGYHRVTKIKFINAGSRCRLFFDMDDCLSTNGRLIVLGKNEGPHTIEYWCGDNSTGRAEIHLAEDKAEIRTFNILTNFVPHKNTIRNTFTRVINGGSVADLSAILSNAFDSLNLASWYHAITKFFGGFFKFGLFKLALGALLALGAWNCFVRGNMVGVFLCCLLFWLLILTDLVIATNQSHAAPIRIVSTITDMVVGLVFAVVVFVLKCPMRAALTTSFVLRTFYCSCLWFVNVVFHMHIVKFELCLNILSETLAVILSVWSEDRIVMLCAFSWLCYIHGKHLMCNSPVVNKGTMYLHPLTALITLKDHSERRAIVNEANNAHNTLDSIIDQNHHRVAGISNAFFCAPNKVKTDKIVVEIEDPLVSGGLTTIRTSKYGTVYVADINKKLCFAVMRHSVEPEITMEDDVCYATPAILSLIEKTAVPYSVLRCHIGESGTAVVKDGKLQFLSGVRNGNPFFVGSVEPPKSLEIVTKVKESTSEADPNIIKVKDPYGTEYQYSHGSLISKKIWAKHSSSKGVPLCADVQVADESTAIYSGCEKLDRKIFGVPVHSAYTFIFNKATATCDAISCPIIGDRIWISKNIKEGLQDVAHVQKSYVFTTDKVLTSGSGIYIKVSCSRYIMISVVTKSFRMEGSDLIHYYISRPNDCRILTTIKNVEIEQKIRNDCADETSPTTIVAFSHYQRGRFHITEFIDTKEKCVMRLQATLAGVGFINKSHSDSGSDTDCGIVGQSPRKRFYDMDQSRMKKFFNRKGFTWPDRFLVDSAIRSIFQDLAKSIPEQEVMLSVGLLKEMKDRRMFSHYNWAYVSWQMLQVRNKNLELNPDAPWWKNYKGIIADTPIDHTAVDFGGDRDLVTPLMHVAAYGKAQIGYQGKVHLIVHPDPSFAKITEISEDNHWQIIDVPDRIPRMAKRYLHEAVSRGLRSIKILISKPYWQELGNEYQGEFDIPAALSLCCALWVETEYVDDFKTYVSNGRNLSRGFLPSLKAGLTQPWHTPDEKLKVSEYGEQLLTYSNFWKRTIASGCAEPHDVLLTRTTNCNNISEARLANKRLHICSLRNFTSRGSCFIYDGSVVTSWHCTKGNAIRVTNCDKTMRFDAPVMQSKAQDIAVYGKKLTFAKMSLGEIVVTFNPITHFGMYFVVESLNATLEGRPGAQFAKLLPVRIDNEANVIRVPYHHGCSGSPIVNYQGDIVGVFGLGTDVAYTTATGKISTVAHFSPIGGLQLDSMAFFEACARNFLEAPKSGEFTACYLNAPTGSGKTTQFPLALAEELIKRETGMGCTHILICQPNVDAVKNGAKRAATAATSMGFKKLKISYTVGIGNEDSDLVMLECDRPTVHIEFKTYGKQWANLAQIEEYQYIILDEVHVIGDENVVAMMVHIETKYHKSNKGVLYMSATHISNANLYDVAQGETIAGSPHNITCESWTIVTDKSDSNAPEGLRNKSRVDRTAGKLHLCSDVIKHKRDDHIVIDMRYISEKTTVFFCATQRDCESGASFAQANGITGYAYHADTKQAVFNSILSEEGTCWVFATNVIQQSVTIPNLVAVVDLGKECRPQVRISDCPLQFVCRLQARDTDLNTFVQRKGRVGRTRPGFCISSPNKSHSNRSVEDFVLPYVVLKLLEHHRSLEELRCHNAELIDALQKLSWMSPENMREKIATADQDYVCDSLIEKHNRKQYRGVQFDWKIKDSGNKPYDPVKHYLRCWITDSEVSYWCSNGQGVYMKDLIKTHPVIKLSEEQEWSEFSSFKDPHDAALLEKERKGKDDDLRVGDTKEYDDQAALEDISEMSLAGPFALGLLGLTGAGVIIYELIDRKCDRYVTHMVSVAEVDVVSCAKFYAEESLAKMAPQSENIISALSVLKMMKNEVKHLLRRKTNKLFELFPWLKPKDKKIKEMSSVDWMSAIEGMLNTAMAAVSNWTATFGMTMGSVFGSLGGGGLLGFIYKDLEKNMGTVLAMVVGAILHGVVFGAMSIKAYGIFAIGQLVTMLVRCVYGNYTRRSGALYTENHNSGTFWSAIIAGGIGVGFSQVFKQTAMQAACHNQISTVISQASVTTQAGAVGVPILLVKNLYHLFTRAKNFGEIAGSATMVATLILTSSPLTFLYSGAAALTIFGLRCFAEYMIDQAARKERDGAGGAQHFEEQKRRLRCAVGAVLDAAAVIVYPSSLISVVIGIISEMAMGSTWRDSCEQSWDAYSGVSPFIAAISEIWRHVISFNRNPVSREEAQQMSITAVSEMWTKFTDLCKRYLGHFNGVGKKIVSTLRKVWDWLVEHLKACIVQPISSVMSGVVGKCVRDNINNNWLTRSVFRMNDEPAEEKKQYPNPNYSEMSAVMLNRYSEGKMLDLDTFWLDSGAGSVKEYGSMFDNMLISEVTLLRPNKGKKIVTTEPLALYQVPMDKLLELLNLTVANCQIKNNVMEFDVPTGSSACPVVKVSFTNTFSEGSMLACIKHKAPVFAGYWLMWFYRNYQGATEINIIEYGDTDGITDQLLATLQAQCSLLAGQPKELTEREFLNLHESLFRVELPRTSVFSQMLHVTKSKVLNMMTEWPDQLRERVKVKHPLNFSYLHFLNIKDMSSEEAKQMLDYCRYWQYYIIKCQNLYCRLSNTEYKSPKWNIPQGAQVHWMNVENPAEPDTAGHISAQLGCQLIRPGYSSYWDTPLLLTSNKSLTHRLLELVSVNYEINVRYCHRGANDQWIEEWVICGSTCPKHFISLIYDGDDHFIRMPDCAIIDHCHKTPNVAFISKFAEFDIVMAEFVRDGDRIFTYEHINKIPLARAVSKFELQVQEQSKKIVQPGTTRTNQVMTLLQDFSRKLGEKSRLVWTQLGDIAKVVAETRPSDIVEASTSIITKAIVHKSNDEGEEMSASLFQSFSDLLKIYFSGQDQRVSPNKVDDDALIERVNFFLTAAQQKELLIERCPTYESIRASSELDTEMEFEDADSVRLLDNCAVIGFTEASKGRVPHWTWYKAEDASKFRRESITTVAPSDVMALYKKLNDRCISKRQWEKLRYADRYRLPSSLEQKANEEVKACSRAFYKMQQLFEADPAFFENCHTILDPACGYGGFSQYLSNKLASGAPKTILAGSLIQKGHRIPDMSRLTAHGSNVRVVNLCRPDLDNGDLRNKMVLNRYLHESHKFEGMDLVLYDMGEFFDNSKDQYNWWTKPAKDISEDNQVSLIEGMATLLKTLRAGGRMLLKWTGYFGCGDELLQKLLSCFKNFKAIKVGTSSLYTTEFYIYASGYTGLTSTSVGRVRRFYEEIGECIYSQLIRANHIMMHPSYYPPMERGDWEYPASTGVVYRADANENRPGGIEWELHYAGKVLKESWMPNWDERHQIFQQVVRRELYRETPTRRLRYNRGSNGTYSKLYQDGWFSRPVKNVHEKHSKNDLLNSLCYFVTKTTDDNSTMGQCQATKEYREASIKKRIDFEAPVLPGYVLEELAEILDLMTTEYGKTIEGKCRLLTKEEVYVMLNKNGATSILSKDANLRNYMETHPNWYELSMHYCVNRWRKNQPTHGFFNIMHKNEAKAKKNVEQGNICLERGSDMKYEPDELREELKTYNNLPHRFIQYADEITRIAHYIILGDLIEKNSIQKIYKGTVNGCPPAYLGNVLRAAWDLNEPNDKHKVFTATHVDGKHVKEQAGANINVYTSSQLPEGVAPHEDDKPCGLSIDYSSWDGSVSVGERMLEANKLASFYPPGMRSTIMNACREMAFAICLDHDGNVCYRSGHRGSGEILTSIGNTQLVAANTIRAICKVLGLTFKEALQNRAVITAKVGQKTKIYEVTRIPQFSDGDDTVILTTRRIAKLIEMNIDEELAIAGKKIRSGTKSGCSKHDQFKTLEFCSHTYESILVGKQAQYVSCMPHQHRSLCENFPEFRIRHLPTRPTTDIIGKLRATLKQSAFKYKHEDDSPTGSKILTRSKLLSYLLLYPHCRYVRYLCLSGLIVTGDGTVNFDEMIRRYPDYRFVLGKTTLMGALDSVYGVATFDDVGLRQYNDDKRDGRQLRRHAKLIGEVLDIRLQSIVSKAMVWTTNYKFRDWTVAAHDSKFCKMIWKSIITRQVRLFPSEIRQIKSNLDLTKTQIEIPDESVYSTSEEAGILTNYQSDNKSNLNWLSKLFL